MDHSEPSIKAHKIVYVYITFMLLLFASDPIADIFETQQNANTALLFAVWYGQHNYVAKLLTDYNADPNSVDMVGRTALHLACTIGNLAITKMLLRHDSKVHVWDNSKKATPLHCAAR
jgi:ankyrin repeat protein